MRPRQVELPVALLELRRMAKKKLTAAERLVDEQMLAMLEWASDHPTRWHPIGKLEATRKAADLLAQGGVIEVWSRDRPVPDQAAIVMERH
jgi:hypothetical protein